MEFKIEDLFQDIKETVVYYLDCKAFMETSAVSKEWKNACRDVIAISDPYLWKKFCESEIPVNYLSSMLYYQPLVEDALTWKTIYEVWELSLLGNKLKLLNRKSYKIPKDITDGLLINEATILTIRNKSIVIYYLEKGIISPPYKPKEAQDIRMYSLVGSCFNDCCVTNPLIVLQGNKTIEIVVYDRSDRQLTYLSHVTTDCGITGFNYNYNRNKIIILTEDDLVHIYEINPKSSIRIEISFMFKIKSNYELSFSEFFNEQILLKLNSYNYSFINFSIKEASLLLKYANRYEFSFLCNGIIVLYKIHKSKYKYFACDAKHDATIARCLKNVSFENVENMIFGSFLVIITKESNLLIFSLKKFEDFINLDFKNLIFESKLEGAKHIDDVHIGVSNDHFTISYISKGSLHHLYLEPISRDMKGIKRSCEIEDTPLKITKKLKLKD